MTAPTISRWENDIREPRGKFLDQYASALRELAAAEQERASA